MEKHRNRRNSLQYRRYRNVISSPVGIGIYIRMMLINSVIRTLNVIYQIRCLKRFLILETTKSRVVSDAISASILDRKNV